MAAQPQLWHYSRAPPQGIPAQKQCMTLITVKQTPQGSSLGELVDQLTWLSRITLAAGTGLSKNGKAVQVQAQMGSHAQPGTPDLSALSPHLQKKWHLNDNLLLGGKVVKPQSQMGVQQMPRGQASYFFHHRAAQDIWKQLSILYRANCLLSQFACYRSANCSIKY